MVVFVSKLYLEEEEISILPCLHPAVVRKGSDVDSWVLIVTVETNGWFPRQGRPGPPRGKKGRSWPK